MVKKNTKISMITMIIYLYGPIFQLFYYLLVNNYTLSYVTPFSIL